MKNNLGKIVFLLLVLVQTILEANSLASYELYANKHSGYVKEPIEITFIAHQKDYNNFMFFFVEPIKSDDYTITLLSKKTKDNSHHNTTATFKFILFPIKAKTIDVDFKFYVKTSSDNAIARAYVADHDEGRGINGVISYIPIKTLNLKIKKLSKKVDLVGDFKLISTIDTQHINQYDNVNLNYKLTGTGFKDSPVLLKEIKDTDIFFDKHDNSLKLTKEGYSIDNDYIYAISAKKDFTIPGIALQAYSPTKKEFYTLQTKPYKIEVTKIDHKTILDKEDSPVKKDILKSQTFKEFFIYIFIFASGYFFAKLTKKEFFIFKRSKKFQDIRDSSNPKELILVLLNRYKNKDIDKFIKELEALLDKKDSIEFYKIQKRVLKEFT